MFQNIERRWLRIFFGIVFLFIVLRIPALQQIYHQDEYKWAQIVKPSYGLAGFSVHPPFTETVFHLWGTAVGFDYLRLLPFFFSIINLVLVIALSYRWFSKEAALWTGLLFTMSAASVFASVQIDIDGTFLPFWTLIALHGATDLWKKEIRRGWLLCGVACVGGFLTKISFGLVPVVLLIEEFFRRGLRVSRRSLMIGSALCIAGAFLWISPLLDWLSPVTYAKSFGILNFFERDYFEVLLLTMKALVLLGPISIVACIGLFKNVSRYRILGIFGLVQCLFYFVVFDFSHRTLERYLLVFIIPIALIAGDVLVQSLHQFKLSRRNVLMASIVSIIGVVIVALPKVVVPLIPKTEFVHRLLDLDFRFLIPISGGSGPIGFFVPADVVLFSFLGMCVLCGVALYRPKMTELVLPSIFTISFLFSLFVASEFSIGMLYGNASAVAKRALDFVHTSSDISRVITYNDIGGWELGESKKYYKRFYQNPEYAQTNEKKFASFDGHYLVVAMPPLSLESPAAKYFTKCKNMYHDVDKKVAADIYDCRGVSYITDTE